ncbi:MAG: HipA domain-containing protein [Asticcacaulis sp.]|nr:HipA domain-containing protein [Asticcacaulis sp.]
MKLDVWLDGADRPAGILESFDNGAVDFCYDPAYLPTAATPLSQSLPLQEGAFGDVLTRAFFDNLLPENDQTRQLIEREGIGRDDIVGILHHLGADCSGAVSCLPEGAPPAKIPGDLTADYEPLSNNAVAAIMTSLADHQRLPDDTDDPSPLAGVQGKIALTVLPDGRWALPKPGRKVPSTHILKVPFRADQGDVNHEWAATRLVFGLRLPVTFSERVYHAGVHGLLISRFDRRVFENKVTRLHQEDFAQALGLPRGLKYERNGKDGRSFSTAAVAGLTDRVKIPAQDKARFLLATMVNLALGNNDNHAKNHALLYVDGPVPVFAPLYDILPVRINDRYTDRLSFDIGNAKCFEDLTTNDIEAFFATFGLEGTRYKRFLETQIKPLFQDLDTLSASLLEENMKGFDDLIGNNLRHLNDILRLGLQIRERDLFVARGGGWLAGS